MEDVVAILSGHSRIGMIKNRLVTDGFHSASSTQEEPSGRDGIFINVNVIGTIDINGVEIGSIVDPATDIAISSITPRRADQRSSVSGTTLLM